MRDLYRFFYLLRLSILCCFLLILSGCSDVAPSSPVDSPSSAESAEEAASNMPDTQPLRSSKPKVYEPLADGQATLGQDPLILDISHIDQGYIMTRYTGGSAKANLQLTGPDGITYKYFFPPSEAYMTIPVTGGSGAYEIAAYENIVDTKYSPLYKETLEITLSSEFLPFLYPNMYVNFSAESQAVSAASDIVSQAASDLDAVAQIYHYIIEHIVYDNEKAQSVPTGYLPDVDETLQTGTGICFDYASLTAAMLRSQNIPTRLEFGYSGQVYHAWISVYIEDIGWIDQLIEFTGDDWTRMDPTFAASNNNNSAILEYIGDGSNYILQYLH